MPAGFHCRRHSLRSSPTLQRQRSSTLRTAASDLKGIRDSGRKPANNKNAPSFERGVRNLAGPNYTLNDDPQPQVLFTLGLSNLKPAPSRLST